jgi:hypothetical protein
LKLVGVAVDEEGVVSMLSQLMPLIVAESAVDFS